MPSVSGWRETRRDVEYRVTGGTVEIVIHHHRDHDPDIWFVSCDAIRMSNKALQSVDVAHAQREAIGIVFDTLERMVSDVRAIKLLDHLSPT